MKTLLITIALIISGSVSAQFTPNNIAFYYDDSGNRIQRKQCACVGNKPAHPIDTISNLNANIQPNPTNGNLAIAITETSFTNNEAGVVEASDETHFHVMVYDIYGRELLNEQHTTTTFKIDITRHPPGAYFVKLYTGDKIKQWKIIKE